MQQVSVQLIEHLRSDQIVAVLIGIAGLIFFGISLVGNLNIKGMKINLNKIPRVLAGIVGLLLLIPAVATALDQQADPEVEIETLKSDCILPLQIVSRGEPMKIGNQWLFLGATTTGEDPKYGNFYVVGGTRRVPQKFTYLANKATDFIVEGQKLIFKATDIRNEWAMVQIAEDQAVCPPP